MELEVEFGDKTMKKVVYIKIDAWEEYVGKLGLVMKYGMEIKTKDQLRKARILLMSHW